MAETEEIKEIIMKLVTESMGKKKYKPGDLFKKIPKENEGISKVDVKEALKQLMDEGKTVYSYKGGSYVELPPE